MLPILQMLENNTYTDFRIAYSMVFPTVGRCGGVHPSAKNLFIPSIWKNAPLVDFPHQ